MTCEAAVAGTADTVAPLEGLPRLHPVASGNIDADFRSIVVRPPLSSSLNCEMPP